MTTLVTIVNHGPGKVLLKKTYERQDAAEPKIDWGIIAVLLPGKSTDLNIWKNVKVEITECP